MEEVEIIDEESLNTRGKLWSPILNCLFGGLLRFGFLLQLVVIVSGFYFFNTIGEFGIFTFDLFSTPEKLRNNPHYTGIMIILESLFLLSSMFIAGFHTLLADNAKEPRGFRSGSKFLCTAATLDIFVGALRLMQYFYAYNFLANRWWLRYIQSSSDWCLFYSSTFLHAIALQFYGFGVFYMDSYHQKTRSSSLPIHCLVLFQTASVLEFLLAFTRYGTPTTLFHLGALLAALLWSCSFESVVNKTSPEYHNRDVNFGLGTADTQRPG